MVVFNDPGSVPENWKPLLEEGNSQAETSSVHLQSPADGQEVRRPVGFCTRCQNGKPPRCHHCSVCKQFLTCQRSNDFLRLWALIKMYAFLLS